MRRKRPEDGEGEARARGSGGGGAGAGLRRAPHRRAAGGADPGKGGRAGLTLSHGSPQEALHVFSKVCPYAAAAFPGLLSVGS